MFGIEYAPGPDPDPSPSEGAPHETAAVLRMQRTGLPVLKIAKMLGISEQQLVHETRIALDDLADAREAGRAIHDSGYSPTVDRVQKYAKDMVVGDYLIVAGSFVSAVLYTAGSGYEQGEVVVRLLTGVEVLFMAYTKVLVVAA